MKSMTKILTASFLLTLAGCGMTSTSDSDTVSVSGARSAVFAIDQLIVTSTKQQLTRSAALLGVFVSEYISFTETAIAAQGAINGIAVDDLLIRRAQSVTDPDYELLQAFADALQVDVADLLNRSTNRQESLDAYVVSLKNVARRSNERYAELTGTVDTLKSLLRTQGKERSDAERALQSAIRKKEFSDAGNLQKTVTEKEQAYAETDLKRKQAEHIVDTLNSLLTLYRQKIRAIESNREILIAGNRIVDVPGIEELKIIERAKKTGSAGRKADAFQDLFEGTGL